MPVAPPTFRPPWTPRLVERAEAKARHDARRGSARARGYDTRWDKARVGYLAAHPLCVCCAAHGVIVAASVLDHIEPHKGDKAKFWQRGNWQGLCEWCDKVLKRPIENAWLAGRAEPYELAMARIVPGWRHPRLR